MWLFASTPDVNKLKTQHDTKGLIKALQYKKDWYVRKNAACALGEMGETQAVAPLSAALRDSQSLVIEAAAQALVKLNNKAAIHPLLECLAAHDEYGIEQEVVKALDALGWTPGHDLVSARYWLRKGDFEQCAACGAVAIEPLLKQVLGGSSDASKAFLTLGAPACNQLISTAAALLVVYQGIAAGTTSLDFSSASDQQKAAVIKELVEKLCNSIVAIGRFGITENVTFLKTFYEAVKTVYCYPGGGFLDMFQAVQVRESIVTALRYMLRLHVDPATLQMLLDILQNEPAHFARWEAVDTLKELADRSADILRDPTIENALKKALQWEEVYFQEQQKQGFSATSSRKTKINELFAKAQIPQG